jgi:uncharacterized protein YdaU (DUF1376 family)
VKIRRIDFSPDEWLAGTIGLSNAERGLYITACALIYSHGGPIPEVELRRSCRDHGHSYKCQLSRLISLGKLISNDGQIDNKRCSNELQKAFKRFSKPAQNEPTSNETNELQEPRVRARGRHHQPSTINHTKEAVASLDCPRDGARGEPRQERSYGPNSRKTRIASDWQPDLADCQYAAGRGWDGGRIGEEADAFADRCNRDGPLYADWHAAWRTWVRNADKFAARDTARAGGANGAARPGPITAAMRAVLSRGGMG